MIGVTRIHGNQLLGLYAANFSLWNPRPAGMRITFHRDPAQASNPLGFELTTHGDGTETKFDGSFQLRNAAGTPTYTVEFWDGSCQTCMTTVGKDPSKPADEEWVIITPKFKITAAGQLAEFESREKTRHAIGK